MNTSYDEDDDEGRRKWDFAGNVNWFPGHMAKGTREMEEQIRDVHAIVEVRDARIPFSSRNPNLEPLLRRKNRIILFNKADLGDSSLEHAIADQVEHEEVRGSTGRVTALFTSCGAQQKRNLSKVMPQLAAGMKLKFSTLGGLVLVLGIPNVGKSTVINKIRGMSKLRSKQAKGRHARRSKTVAVGAQPGVTKNVSKVQVWDQPAMFMMDSPGIMYPRIHDPETALKLTLTGAIKDKIIGEEILCDYLLYQLNLPSRGADVGHKYVAALGLDAPTENLSEVLRALGSDSVGDVNACRKFLAMYRSGALGHFCLDEVLPYY